MSGRPTVNPVNARFSFSALEVEGGDDDSHTESEGELVEAPLTPPPPNAQYVYICSEFPSYGKI